MYDRILACDIEIFKHLNGDLGSFVDTLMLILTSRATLISTIIISLFFLYKKLQKKEFIYAFFAVLLIVLLADQGCNFFKDTFPRARPMFNDALEDFIYLVNNKRGGGFSGTVSAHAANSFGTLIYISLLLKNKSYKIFAIILASLISYSRIYLGYHFPLDVCYGTILGFAVAYFVHFLTLIIFKKINTNNSYQ